MSGFTNPLETSDLSGIYVLRQPIADTIINESGGNFDWRMEGVGDEKLFYLDSGNDAVFIGQSSGNTGVKFEVNGNISIGGSNNELRFYEGVNYVGFEAPTLSADQIWILPTADGSVNQVMETDGSGSLSWIDQTRSSEEIWSNVMTVSRTDNDTITFTAASTAAAEILVAKLIGALAYWTDSGGSNERKGFIRTASNSGATITIELIGDTFAVGDKNFRYTSNIKVQKMHWYHPGQLVADANNAQGNQYRIKHAAYFFSSDSGVKDAAAGAGVAAAYNLYKNNVNTADASATALYSSAPNLTTNGNLDDQKCTTREIAAGQMITTRITASAGATNKASGLTIQGYWTYQHYYDAV